jgi:hypothetical protein
MMRGNIKQMIMVGIFLFGIFLLFNGRLQAEETIIDDWSNVKAPKAPEIRRVKVDPKDTALLVLDIEELTCNLERRPRCIASVPKIKTLITKARASGMPVVYSLTPKGTPETILKEVVLIISINTEQIQRDLHRNLTYSMYSVKLQR